MKVHEQDIEQPIRRFHLSHILEHWMLMITFSILAVTGLSQKFYNYDFAQWIIIQLGGIDDCRRIHRITGVFFFSLAMFHIVRISFDVIIRRSQPHMLITMNDFRDLAHNFKYYIGMEHAPARCDRYSYKEKFMYWLILTGGVAMILTGLILWFPVVAARFLPGHFIPAAKAVHTNEAMLIFLLIAVWHIYDSIFSPYVFPLDSSIFSGYISRERMQREHLLELMRLEGASEEEILNLKRFDEVAEEGTHTSPP